MRTTHTYATIEIPAEAWDAIKKSIEDAGKEYVSRYIDKEVIHWGGEVGLVVKPKPVPPVVELDPPGETEDVFKGRCTPGSIPEVFTYSKIPYGWRKDNTCSHCGGLRPSIALKMISEGASVTPTDKSYKMYVNGTKCYFNHFSESQALEFVRMIEEKTMKIGHPGHFYSNIAFGEYREVIHKYLDSRKEEP